MKSFIKSQIDRVVKMLDKEPSKVPASLPKVETPEKLDSKLRELIPGFTVRNNLPEFIIDGTVKRDDQTFYRLYCEAISLHFEVSEQGFSLLFKRAKEKA